MPSYGQPTRAYQFWHRDKMTLDTMCAKLSLKKRYGLPYEDINLKPATVM